MLEVRVAAPVLGEALREPERQHEVGRAPVVAEHARQLVEREHVDQFVPDDALEAVQVAVGRDHDAALEELEEAADAVRDEARRHVGLLEVQVGRVEDDRDAVRQRQVEARLQRVVPVLGRLGADGREVLGLGVVVDVEVLRFEDVPLEAVVLDLVAPEPLRARRGGQPQEGQRDEEESEAVRVGSRHGVGAAARLGDARHDPRRAQGQNRRALPDPPRRRGDRGGTALVPHTCLEIFATDALLRIATWLSVPKDTRHTPTEHRGPLRRSSLHSSASRPDTPH